MRRKKIIFDEKNFDLSGKLAVNNIPHLSEEEILEAQKEARGEAIKSAAKAQETVKHIVETTSRAIFTCTSVFPFDFFPDELIIEETRINIVEKKFWLTADIRAVGVEDITEVAVYTSLFFATLRIGSRTFIDNVVDIRFLHKKDAMRARRIIEGLRMLKAQNVDMSALDILQLRKKVEEIGAIKRTVI